jgi:lysophospholipase L1-like esterase
MVKTLPSISSAVRRSAVRRLGVAIGGTALVAGMLVVVLLPRASATPAASTSRSAVSAGWVASWAASPMAGTSISATAHAGFKDQTVRNIIYTSVGGDELRVQLSNVFGATALSVGAASVGVVLDGAQLVPGTSHPLTFRGKTSVTIPAGQQVLSDPLAIDVQPLQELAVSIYLPERTGPATYHFLAQQTGYIASGDHAGEASAAAYSSTDSSWFFLTGLDVHDPSAPGTIVAFGDSITDGDQSLAGVNARWPNYLARRLDAALGRGAPAVVDEGIIGNRVLSDSSCFGLSAEARFERDALSQPGVKDVILLEGINDIGFSGQHSTGCYAPANATVTAAQIEAGYADLIRLAHAKGVRIYAGTLTPFMGSNASYGGNDGTAYGEALRAQVNTWILTSHAFDGVIDFSRALQDPDNPLYLNPEYNSGDSLHPGDVGYELMADIVPLDFLR